MFLHRFTQAVAAASFLLVIVGGAVSSTGWEAGGVLFQQGHRTVGAFVGLLTTLLALAYLRAETRPWVRFLPIAALAVIVAQGTLGAFALFSGLPAVLSSSHAGLAQIFFAMVVALAVISSEGWKRAYDVGGSGAALVADARLRHLAVASIAVVYLQVMLGAVVRHTSAARAIPDYPLSFGGLVPGLDSLVAGPVVVSFAHRLGALAVAVVLFGTAWRIISRYRERRELVRPAMFMLMLVAAEVMLGAVAVATDGAAFVGTALVAAGALLLATTVVLALRVHRPLFQAVPQQAATTC